MTKKIAIIDYGAGNIQSVLFALERLGVEANLTNNPEQIKAAEKVIFPGVGHATPALNALKKTGLDLLIPQLKQPVLGVCLGMQLMCRFSEENNEEALGIFNVDVKKFPANEKVPHMGWNSIEVKENPLVKNIQDNSYFYFVHSYYAELGKETIATTHYGLPFSAALQKDNFYGCQFHPEKSGGVGQKILENFIKL